MKKIVLLVPFVLLRLTALFCQNYHAIYGSPYAASLAVGNNPAVIVNTPVAWDITPLAVQYKTSTNAFTVFNYSLLSSPMNSAYSVRQGDFSRYVNTNFNTHVLNARFALNRRQAIAFGINLRGYGQVKTSAYNFSDTLQTFRQFLNINQNHNAISGDMTSSVWTELYGAYSFTLWDKETGRLNGGITLKANRGMSGAFASLENAGVALQARQGQRRYTLAQGSAKYGYSGNYDNIQSNKPPLGIAGDFVKTTRGSFSLDLGIEYIVKSQAVNAFGDDDDYYEYEWKFGAAILDIGNNQYRYGTESRFISDPQPDVFDTYLENRFRHTTTLQQFNDSLSAIVKTIMPLAGKFVIATPARLVVNVDRNLGNNYYINAELSANLSALHGAGVLYNSEMNMVSVTPRWESRRWGIYLPILYNTEGQLWVGGSLRAGPLLLGVHNLANVFAKTKFQNGGAYLAFIVKPGTRTKAPRYKGFDCPR